MISSKAKVESPDKIRQDEPLTTTKTSREKQRVNALHVLMWMILLLACLGISWFSYQYFFVPQPKNYAPDWHGAQWVRAADSSSPVAYFRYVSQLDTLPDTAFVTIAANQTFVLYVNGSYIGSNSVDFVQGDAPRAYMYDVDSVLQPGPNVIAVRVMNVDTLSPALQASFGVLWGKTIAYHGTGDSSWQATGQSALARPRYTPKLQNWSTPLFDASSWAAVQKETHSPGSPMLTVDPLTFEQPLPTSWINAGAGHDSYFTHQFSLSPGFTEVLLRLTATGTADIFINGHLFATWQSQTATPQENVVSYLSDGSPVLEYRAGLAMGVYDISPYLHLGENTIAVHVSSPGLSASTGGLATLGSAMTLDVLAGWPNRYDTVVTSDIGWHASPHPVEGWTQASSASLAWPPAALVGRPGESRVFYLPDSNTPRNIQSVSPVLVAQVILLSAIAVLGLWLLMSLIVVRRYYLSRIEACEAMSLALLPALALEALLLTLSHEPQMPDPFPYTWQWGLALIALVGVSYFLLWLHARRTFLRRDIVVTHLFNKPVVVRPETDLSSSSKGQYVWLHLVERVRPWLAKHWLLIPIVLVAIPMIFYNLGYEPYWQDELSSYYAAKGILAHGIPIYISGFLYAKGEAYSYLLALSMAIFGDQNGMPRLVSALEYLICLPLFYGIGCYFFDRRVALLSTAMLAFSPYALLWGRQTRMYEQAFLMTLIVAYILYYALQHYQRVRPVYLAIACVVIAYLSHEETFIILPAIIICVLLFSPKGKYGVPLVLRQKHWWYALLIGAAIIGLQLLIVFVTHPPHLGTDQSRRPQIQPTFDNVSFYLDLFFNSATLREGIMPWIIVQPLFAVDSVLAILGCIWALRQPNNKIRYCALMLILSLLTLTFIFTMQADRYVYPLFSLYYLMSAYAVLRILRVIWAFARPYLRSGRSKYSPAQRPVAALSRPALVIVVGTMSLLCASVLILPMLPLSNYNLFFSHVTGLSYHRHFPDYDDAGQYVQSHWQKGDIIATIAPDLSTYYYFNGHAEYFFSVDRSLYLFERNGQIIDTSLGERALLNEADFQALLASHARIWLISDNGNYQAGATKGGRFIFPPPDFQLVYEGYGSAVYFRGSS